MPSRSMSPSTEDSTLVRVMPRAAAMFATPDVRQAAMACSRYSTGVGPWSVPTSTSGWSETTSVRWRCAISWPTPWKPSYVDTEWVPFTQWLAARNWNFAIAGLPRTASRVASRVETSTPLVCGCSVVVVMSVAPPDRTWAGRVVVMNGQVGTLGRPPSLDLPEGTATGSSCEKAQGRCADEGVHSHRATPSHTEAGDPCERPKGGCADEGVHPHRATPSHTEAGHRQKGDQRHEQVPGPVRRRR